MQSRGVPGRVSCILVTSDDEHYVGYSLLSLLDHVDEISVLGLGSSDGSRAVLQQVAEQSDSQGKLGLEFAESGAATADAVTAALARCTGDWIWLVSAGQVYDEPTGERIERWLRGGEIHPAVCSLGWPRFRFCGEDLHDIVEFAEPQTVRTFALRNLEGLQFCGADLHEGWSDAAGQPLGVDHLVGHASIINCSFGVHDYAADRDPGRRHAATMPCDHGHPEVFWRQDLRPWMQRPEFVDPSRRGAQQAHLAKAVFLSAQPPTCSY